MSEFVKLPIRVQAHRWFKNGDHPLDAVETVAGPNGSFETEGEIVGRYMVAQPLIHEMAVCPECFQVNRTHGFIKTLEGGMRVCPGDWIITGIKGERYPVKAAIFAETYKPVAAGGYSCHPEDDHT